MSQFRKFSVLMSLYYKESRSNLIECLQSLKDQILLPSEVIIVFDGKVPDDLELVIQDYISILNIKICRLEKNVGLGMALQFGLEKCSYELVARMDTDDICLENRFLRQMIYLNENPDVDILGSSIIEFNESNGTQREKILPLTGQDIKRFSLLKNPINHMTVFFKKSKILAIGSYRHHLYMEDYDLWLRSIKEGLEIRNIDEILVLARINNELASKRRGLDYIRSEVKLYNLKNNLGIYPNYKLIFSFFIRLITRLIPKNLLTILYNFDRKRIK